MSIILYLIFLLAFVTQSRSMTLFAGNAATIAIAPVTACLALTLAALSLMNKHPGKSLSLAVVISCYVVIALKNTLVDSVFLAGFAFVIFQASYLFNPDFAAHIEHSLRKRYTYLTFYPQMMCGPILKPRHFSERPHSARQKSKMLDYGLALFISGLALKTLAANHFQTWIEQYGAPFFNGLDYALYVYTDFASWSMMACGISYCIGIRFPRNFKFPWRHIDASAFWQRWNTTLFTWVTEQVVSHARKQRLPMAVVLLISVLTLGLWHGLKWNFLGFAIAILLWYVIGNMLSHRLTRFVWFIFAFNCTGALFYAEAPKFTYNLDALLNFEFIVAIAVFGLYEAGGTYRLYSFIREYPAFKAMCLVIAPWLAFYDLTNPYFFYMRF